MPIHARLQSPVSGLLWTFGFFFLDFTCVSITELILEKAVNK